MKLVNDMANVDFAGRVEVLVGIYDIYLCSSLTCGRLVCILCRWQVGWGV